MKMSFNATTAFLLPGPPESPAPRLGAFQCHHGVPASASLALGHLAAKAVSMPPRRSCFPAVPVGMGGGAIVSMPPRRSCFTCPQCNTEHGEWGFNATTAFLLRC